MSAKAVDGNDPGKLVRSCLLASRARFFSLESGVFRIRDDLKPVGAGPFAPATDLGDNGKQQIEALSTAMVAAARVTQTTRGTQTAILVRLRRGHGSLLAWWDTQRRRDERGSASDGTRRHKKGQEAPAEDERATLSGEMRCGGIAPG